MKNMEQAFDKFIGEVADQLISEIPESDMKGIAESALCELLEGSKKACVEDSTEHRTNCGKVDLFREITAKMADTYEAKNHDYGDSFSILRAKYPESICIRLMDKLLRLERLIGGRTAMVSESIEDTLLDIANYAVMELVERRLEHEN